MRKRLVVSLAAGLLVAACGRTGPAGPTATPSALANLPVVETVTPPPSAAPYPASATPVPSATEPEPTATTVADGVTLRMTTPDPNPNCPEHYPWYFENRADECAAVLLNTWAVWQPFEHGLMVWTQEAGRTYVLIEDGAPFKPYQVVSDPFGLPLPEPDPSQAPPEGFYQPERGFALFWRSLVPGHEWVRQRLGWATAPEQAYSGFRQCNTATDATARCYLNGPNDQIIVLAEQVPWWAYVQTGGP
jgi:hypothetical protein